MGKTIDQLVSDGDWIKYLKFGKLKVLSTDFAFDGAFQDWKNNKTGTSQMSLVYEKRKG